MTDAELAILTIIAEKPIAGCDVQDVIAERNIRMWTLIGVESLYYLIQKLEQQGLIRNIDEHPPDDHKLRVYRVTPAGMGVLQTAITDLLSSPHLLPRGLEIGLANLPVLSSSQAHHALKGYRDALQSRYESASRQYEVLSGQGAPFHILSMFEHHLALIEAEIVWFDEWLTRWKSQVDWKTDTSIPADPHVDIPRMHQVILPQDPDSFHKRPTRRLDPDRISDIEFPPPPERRERTSKPSSDTTRKNNPTRSYRSDEDS